MAGGSRTMVTTARSKKRNDTNNNNNVNGQEAVLEECGGCPPPFTVHEVFNPCPSTPQPDRVLNSSASYVTPDDRPMSSNDNKEEDSFSIVEWIHQSLPCIHAAVNHVEESAKKKKSDPERCCSSGSNNNNVLTAQQQIQSSHHHYATQHSWLSGHLGLIPPQQQQSPPSSSSSLIKPPSSIVGSSGSTAASISVPSKQRASTPTSFPAIRLSKLAAVTAASTSRSDTPTTDASCDCHDGSTAVFHCVVRHDSSSIKEDKKKNESQMDAAVAVVVDENTVQLDKCSSCTDNYRSNDNGKQQQQQQQQHVENVNDNNTTTDTSKRKLLALPWSIPVKPVTIITATHKECDSAEVIKMTSSEPTSEDHGTAIIKTTFANVHEEIVTALIDSALMKNNDDKTLQHSNTDPGKTTTSPIRRPSFPSSSPIRRPSMTTAASTAITPIRSKRIPRQSPPTKKNSSKAKLSSPWKQKHQQQRSRKKNANNNEEKQNGTTKCSTADKKQPLDYIHPNCQLMKEKGADNNKKRSGGKNRNSIASAAGREAVLEKLQEKLSMLGDIESGKYGKAAEMLQSDAVAFLIPASPSERRRGTASTGTTTATTTNSGGRGHVRSGSCGSSTVAYSRDSTHDVETVGMPPSSSSLQHPAKAYTIETRSLLTLRMGFVSMSYGILLQWDPDSKLVELIVLRKMCREDFLEQKDEEQEQQRHDVDSSSVGTTTMMTTRLTSKILSGDSVASGTTSLDSREVESSSTTITGLSLLSQLRGDPQKQQQQQHHPERPRSFLSVSVVNVKQIHTGCDLCLDSRFFHDPSKSKDKRKILRPYIRFVLGKNEHCTKPGKLLPNGHLYYYKRHNNSCQLPMPKEEFRWFAGQEDLVVEVRDFQAITNTCEKTQQKNKLLPGGKNIKSVSKDDSFSSTDPILAVVTVPLSSVNIEDEDDKISTSDGEDSLSLIPWRHRKTKKSDFRDETSSTNITLPLRMVGCSSPSFGSITLQITAKVPQISNSGASSQNVPSASNNTSNTRGVAEESIEIGAIARIMQGWTVNDTTADSDSRKTRKLRRRKMRKPQLRWNKKWNPKTKKWSQLKLSNHGSSRATNAEHANWLGFLKWGDER